MREPQKPALETRNEKRVFSYNKCAGPREAGRRIFHHRGSAWSAYNPAARIASSWRAADVVLLSTTRVVGASRYRPRNRLAAIAATASKLTLKVRIAASCPTGWGYGDRRFPAACSAFRMPSPADLANGHSHCQLRLSDNEYSAPEVTKHCMELKRCGNRATCSFPRDPHESERSARLDSATGLPLAGAHPH